MLSAFLSGSMCCSIILILVSFTGQFVKSQVVSRRRQKRITWMENELIFGNLDHARDQNNTFLSLSLTHRETRKLRGSKKTIGWLLTGVLLPSRHVRRIEKWAPPPKKVNFWGIGACPHFARSITTCHQLFVLRPPHFAKRSFIHQKVIYCQISPSLPRKLHNSPNELFSPPRISRMLCHTA